MEAKQVIVIRKDLNMRKGKMVAQGCHACLGAVLQCKWQLLLLPFFPNTPLYKWLRGPFVKICVSVNSENEFLTIAAKVRMNKKIPLSVIKDAGRTEFKGVATYTALGIGPWWADELDEITGHLKLL